MLPSTFNLMFTIIADNHNYNTRFTNNFKYPCNKLEFGKKSISYHGVKIWNNISDEIKNSENIKGFKVNYKKFLISNFETIALISILFYSYTCKKGVWDQTGQRPGLFSSSPPHCCYSDMLIVNIVS